MEGGAEFIRTRLVQETEYQYKYNDYGGKSFEKAFDEHTARRVEWQDELELSWYVYGARNYACPVAKQYGNPAIGRWFVQDPIVHFNHLPYGGFDGTLFFG